MCDIIMSDIIDIFNFWVCFLYLIIFFWKGYGGDSIGGGGFCKYYYCYFFIFILILVFY